MSHARAPTADVLELARLALEAGQSGVDLAPLGVPLRVSANLYEAVVGHDGPELALFWSDTTLYVRRLDGGLIASLDVVF
jgi:hypothetical protein